MKKLILSTLILTSAAASAALPTESESWNKITSAYKYKTEVGFPSIALDNGPVVSVANLCFDGEKLKTTMNIESCVEYTRLPRGEKECAQTASYIGLAAMSGERVQCTDYINLGRGERECAQYEAVPYTNSLSHEVPVYKKTSKGNAEFDYKLLFTKTYTVPSC